MRFGICAGADHAALLEEAGFDYIELGVAGTLAPEQAEEAILPALEAALAKSSLKAEAFNGFLPGDLKVVGPELDLDRQARYLASAFKRVQRLGGSTVVFGSGGARAIPEGFSRETARTQVVDFLRRAGAAAVVHGITIAIEPLNAGECNFINSVAEGLELVELAGHPSVRVLSDLYHVAKDGQSYAETTAAGTRLAHVHVATLEGRRAPVTPDLDFLTAYFAAVYAAGYEGRVSIEGAWDGSLAQASEALETLQAAWAWATSQ